MRKILSIEVKQLLNTNEQLPITSDDEIRLPTVVRSISPIRYFPPKDQNLNDYRRIRQAFTRSDRLSLVLHYRLPFILKAKVF